LSEQEICFVHDLLDKNGKFLSLENVKHGYNVRLNFFQYFQLIAAIPNYLKKTAQQTAVTNREILNERDVFYLSDNKALYLTKLRCKDYFISGKVQCERTYRCEKLDQVFSQLICPYYPTVLVNVQKVHETDTNIPQYCTVGYCTEPCVRSSCYTCSFLSSY